MLAPYCTGRRIHWGDLGSAALLPYFNPISLPTYVVWWSENHIQELKWPSQPATTSASGHVGNVFFGSVWQTGSWIETKVLGSSYWGCLSGYLFPKSALGNAGRSGRVERLLLGLQGHQIKPASWILLCCLAKWGTSEVSFWWSPYIFRSSSSIHSSSNYDRNTFQNLALVGTVANKPSWSHYKGGLLSQESSKVSKNQGIGKEIRRGGRRGKHQKDFFI